jgi:hypothetical protein
MDLVLGDPDAVEERLAREPLVRVGMMGRHVALVAPPDVPAPPVEVALGEALVDGADGRSAGQRDPKRLGLDGAVSDPGGGVLG